MNDHKNDTEITKHLKDLPNVKDHRSKETVYNQVMDELNEEYSPPKRKKVHWVIPSIATAAVLLLSFIILQMTDIADDQAAEETDPFAVQSVDEGENEDEIENEVEVENEDTTMNREEVEVEEETAEEASESEFIYYQEDSSFPIFQIAVYDKQGQYVIPISLVSTSSTYNPEDYYNRISTFIDEVEYGVELFPFDEGFEFEFDESNEVIRLTVDSSYDFPSSSTQAYLFQEAINFMFSNFSANELEVRTTEGEDASLGPIGEVDSLSIESVERLAFQIYQYEDSKRLLLPIAEGSDGDEFFTIDEALVAMQESRSDFVEAVIPSDVEFSLDPSNESRLEIDFSEHSDFGDNSLTKDMIEAILMTAKSFDYDEVELSIEGIEERIGHFYLGEAIDVPDGVNPIVLH
ncbi:hypothetical protein SAMN05421734_102447 [Pelagirhabdus alkalitolerans]|uniref:Sporulation and spore germination n=1 Tax=Pelagirhabdus alkalitolerans TaxID=1612202 RepID=A0A1G6HBC0_9BACI|nr:hypothetical protein [Pelagirhabdus alkalitolerans]SDB91560.1 hypothetical protein SAMN05421734_102447 [Pelagirhabdus alkalitolerans]